MSVWLQARIISTPSCVFALSSSLRLGRTLLSLFLSGLPEDSMFIYSDLTKIGQHQEVTFLEMERFVAHYLTPFAYTTFGLDQCIHPNVLTIT